MGIIESCNNGNVLGEESVGGFIGNAHNSYVKYSMANGIVKATKIVQVKILVESAVTQHPVLSRTIVVMLKL